VNNCLHYNPQAITNDRVLEIEKKQSGLDLKLIDLGSGSLTAYDRAGYRCVYNSIFILMIDLMLCKGQLSEGQLLKYKQ